SGADIIDHDTIAQFFHFGIKKMQYSKYQGGNDQRDPSFTGHDTNALHKVPAHKIFFKTGLKGNQENGNDTEDNKWAKLKIKLIVLRGHIEVYPHNYARYHCPQSKCEKDSFPI